jgi:putative endonuclease
MAQHKAGLFDGFTRKYQVDRLMYFETYSDSKVAAQREQQLKKWRREKKILLFAESNPHWKDITPEIHQTIGLPPLRQAQGRDFRKKEEPTGAD